MDKKRENLLFIFDVTDFHNLCISHTKPLSQSLPLDRRFPKEIAQSPLPKLLDFGRGTCIPCKSDGAHS